MIASMSVSTLCLFHYVDGQDGGLGSSSDASLDPLLPTQYLPRFALGLLSSHASRLRTTDPLPPPRTAPSSSLPQLVLALMAHVASKSISNLPSQL